MDREIDERVFWCKNTRGELVPYNIPPVGKGLPKGATDFPLIFPAFRIISQVPINEVVRAVCAVPKTREYKVYVEIIMRVVIQTPHIYDAEFEQDFMQCLRETFIGFGKYGCFTFTDKAIIKRELNQMLGFKDYNQKRVKTLLTI